MIVAEHADWLVAEQHQLLTKGKLLFLYSLIKTNTRL